MDQGGSIKIAYRDVGGRATQGAVAESSQIFPEFVQAQTANKTRPAKSLTSYFGSIPNTTEVPPSCNMGVSVDTSFLFKLI